MATKMESSATWEARILKGFFFTPYEKGHKIKDEEALGAIVAHLNKLEGVDLEPDFLSKSASGPWEILVTGHS